ncbi:MAG: ATP-binding protein, partial [Chlamydiota bacterium]|nr:ATP-binding protein [Chlamydiota bacterium]
EFLSDLAKDMALDGVKTQDLPDFLVFGYLDQSAYLAEDHVANHFVWVNRVVESIPDPSDRRAVLRLTRLHEIRHEANVVEKLVFKQWVRSQRVPEGIEFDDFIASLSGRVKEVFEDDVESEQYKRDQLTASMLYINEDLLSHLNLSKESPWLSTLKYDESGGQDRYERKRWYLNAAAHEINNVITNLSFLGMLSDNLPKYYLEFPDLKKKLIDALSPWIGDRDPGEFLEAVYDKFADRQHPIMETFSRLSEMPYTAEASQVLNQLFREYTQHVLPLFLLVGMIKNVFLDVDPEYFRSHESFFFKYLASNSFKERTQAIREMIEEGRMARLSDRKTWLNVPLVLDEAVNVYLGSLYANKKLDVIWEGFSPAALIPKSLLNGRHLRQVIKNLVINARHAVPDDVDKGRMVVSLSYDESTGRLLIRMRDYGVGIAPEHRENIFRPFYTTKGAGGSGIGLAISKEMIELAGGTLKNVNPADDSEKWTEFQIELPTLAAPMAEIYKRLEDNSERPMRFLQEVGFWFRDTLTPQFSSEEDLKEAEQEVARIAAYYLDPGIQMEETPSSGMTRGEIHDQIRRDALNAKITLSYLKRFQAQDLAYAQALYHARYPEDLEQRAIEKYFEEKGYRVDAYLKEREARTLRVRNQQTGHVSIAKIAISEAMESPESFPAQILQALPDLEGIDPRINLPEMTGQITYADEKGMNRVLGYYQSALIEGDNLTDVLSAREVSTEQVAIWIKEILEQVESLYQQGWEYWDIQTGTVMIDRAGHARLIDLDNIMPKGDSASHQIAFIRLKNFIEDVRMSRRVPAEIRKGLVSFIDMIDEEFYPRVYEDRAGDAFALLYQSLNQWIGIGKPADEVLTELESRIQALEQKMVEEGYPDEVIQQYQDVSRTWERMKRVSGEMDNRKNIKVMVAAYNDPASLNNLLESIYEELKTFEYGKAVEVVVVDQSDQVDAQIENERRVQEWNARLTQLGHINWSFRYMGGHEQYEKIKAINEMTGQNVEIDHLGFSRPIRNERELLARGTGPATNIAIIMAQSEVEQDANDTAVIFFDQDAQIQALLLDPSGEERRRKLSHFFHQLGRAFLDPNVGVVSAQLNGDPGDGYTGMAAEFHRLRERLEQEPARENVMALVQELPALRAGKYRNYHVYHNRLGMGPSQIQKLSNHDIVPFVTGFAIKAGDLKSAPKFNMPRGSDAYQQIFMHFQGLQFYGLGSAVIHEKSLVGREKVNVFEEFPDAARLSVILNALARWLRQSAAGTADIRKLASLGLTQAEFVAEREASDMSQDLQAYRRRFHEAVSEASKILTVLKSDKIAALGIDVQEVITFFERFQDEDALFRYVLTRQWGDDHPDVNTHDLADSVLEDLHWDVKAYVNEWPGIVLRWQELISTVDKTRVRNALIIRNILEPLQEGISFPSPADAIHYMHELFGEYVAELPVHVLDGMMDEVVLALPVPQQASPIADFIGQDYIDTLRESLRSKGYANDWVEAMIHLLEDPDIPGAVWVNPETRDAEGSRLLLRMFDALAKALTPESETLKEPVSYVREGLFHEYIHQILHENVLPSQWRDLRDDLLILDPDFIINFAKRYGTDNVEEVIAKYLSMRFV